MKTKVLISKKQRELLLCSATIRQDIFSDLYQHLQKHETVTFNDLHTYTSLHNLTSYLDELLKSSSSEWSPSPTTPIFDLGPGYRKEKITCDLCGHKYIRLQFRIHNHILKKEMVIGSECIKEFGANLKNSFGSNSKDIQRAGNRLFLESEFPGIREYIESKKIIHSYGMVVPKIYVNKWRQLREELYQAYSKYISGKEKKLNSLNLLWQQKQQLDLEIKAYISANKDKPFAVKGDLQKWLLQYQSEEFMNELQANNGFITSSTIHKIYEPNFMEKTLAKATSELFKYGIILKDVAPNTNRIHLEFTKNNRTLSAYLTYFTLMKEISNIFFDSTFHIDFNAILKNATITSKSTFLNWLQSNVDALGYKIIFVKKDDLVISKSKNYYLADVKTTLDIHKIHFFENNSSIQVHDWINSLKKMNQKEFNIYKELKKNL